MSASLSARFTRRLSDSLTSFRDALLDSTGLTPVARIGKIPQHMRVYVQPVLPSQTPSAAISVLESANEMRRRLQDWLQKPVLADLIPSLNKNLMDIFRRKSGVNPAITEIQNRMTGRRTPAAAIDRDLGRKINAATNRDFRRDNALLGLVRRLNATRQAHEVSQDYASLEAYINTGTTTLQPPSMCGQTVDWQPGRRLDQITVSAKRREEDGGRPGVTIGTGYGLLIDKGEAGAPPKAWLGLRVMRLNSSDAERNRAAIEQKRTEIAQALGLPPGKIALKHHKDCLSGTSVLLEDENLVAAHLVNSAWSAQSLETHFGETFAAFHRKTLATKRETASLPPDLQAFMAMTSAPSAPKKEEGVDDRGPGADQAIVLLRERSLDLVSRSSGASLFGVNMRSLWPGDYQIFETLDAAEPVGVLRVTSDRITQLAYHPNEAGFKDLLEHNFRLTTPSSMPVTGRDGEERYAHYGKNMSKDDLRAVRAQDRQRQAYRPAAPAPEDSSKTPEIVPESPAPSVPSHPRMRLDHL